jgi:hypothetical protein
VHQPVKQRLARKRTRESLEDLNVSTSKKMKLKGDEELVKVTRTAKKRTKIDGKK